MQGAQDRHRRERALTWWAAMMPRMQKPPSFGDFVDPQPVRKRQSREVLQAMCDALAASWGAKKVSK